MLAAIRSQAVFVPSLYTVATGAYATDQEYGAGAAHVSNYDSVMTVANRYGKVTRNDDKTHVSISMITNTGAVAPVLVATDELRVHVYHMPTAHTPNGLLFNVEITNETTGAPIPLAVAGAGRTMGRLLHSDEIALVAVSDAASPTVVTPLTVADLTPIFAAARIRIKMFATYHAA